MFYAEFYPKDFDNDRKRIVKTFQECCLERYHTTFNEKDCQYGKLRTVSGLYYLKAFIVVEDKYLTDAEK